MSQTIVSPSPHIHGNDSVRRNMMNVLIALIPAYLVSLYNFGLGALIVSLVSMATCVLTEFIITRFILKEKNTIGDLSALLTGALLAFNLPSNLPWWMVILGAVFAIGVGKMCFGGLGNNPFNPALVGRVFLLISFPAAMTTWPVPDPFSMNYMDAATGATPLSMLAEGMGISGATVTGPRIPDHLEMFLGQTGGSMGEIAEIALLIGFIYLLATKTITWHIPVTIIATVALLATIFYHIPGTDYMDPLQHLCSGGLMLGAIFMATDYATSPMTKKGQIIYAIGIGVITIVIRVFGSYPEGMSFAILIMNAVTPLINNYIKPRRFGE